MQSFPCCKAQDTPQCGCRAEAEFSNAATQQEAERAERAMKAAAAALKVRSWQTCHSLALPRHLMTGLRHHGAQQMATMLQCVGTGLTLG